MRTFPITALVLGIMVVGTSTPAFADEHDNRQDEHGNRQDEHGNRQDEHGNRQDEHGNRQDDHGSHQYVHHDEWRRGAKIRDEDWGRGEHIDYRERHLRAPPRGYEWRQVDGNYVLAAIATGVIASVIVATVAGR